MFYTRTDMDKSVGHQTPRRRVGDQQVKHLWIRIYTTYLW